MENPKGRVVALVHEHEDTRAIVDVDAQTVCPRCAAGRGCGAGIFTGSQKTRRVEATIPSGLDVREGDLVLLELAPRHLLRAAMIVYGLPLAGAAIGAAAAYTAGLGDPGAAALAILGLLTGLYAGRRRLARQTCLAELTPVVAGYPAATTEQR